MKQDVCPYLPQELMFNILSRLSFGRLIRYKCVCKSWLDLIESCEFGKAHLCNSKSTPGLAFFEECSRQYHFYKYLGAEPVENVRGGLDSVNFFITIFKRWPDKKSTLRKSGWRGPQFRPCKYLDEHEHEHEHDEPDKRYFSIAFKLRLPANLYHLFIRDSSVNGLLLFADRYIRPDNYFICNPITRDYIKLPSSYIDKCYELQLGFGFGVSRISGEYKIVMVTETKCEVYTLGTGSWRSVAPCSYDHLTTATFVNGNLHWLIHESKAFWLRTVVGISCFDLETELFTIFSLPRALPPHKNGCYCSISSLEESLTFCYYAYGDFVIWLMNDYGDDKSWTMRLIINQMPGNIGYGFHFPIKLFKDGDDILIAQLYTNTLLCYINKTKHMIRIYNPPFLRGFDRAFSYTPSFLSLKTFTMENVSSF